MCICQPPPPHTHTRTLLHTYHAAADFNRRERKGRRKEKKDAEVNVQWNLDIRKSGNRITSNMYFSP